MERLGDVREDMAKDCWAKAEELAELHRTETKPFYIIFTAKADPNLSGADAWGKHVSGGIRQSFRLCYERPPFLLGMLVWYVDNQQGIFQFVPELSSPPDIPLDPSLLSTKSYDQFVPLMNKAQKMNRAIPLIS